MLMLHTFIERVSLESVGALYTLKSERVSAIEMFLTKRKLPNLTTLVHPKSFM